MLGKKLFTRSENQGEAAEVASPAALYKFERQPYRLLRLDLRGLRAERGDMSMAGTLRYITGSGSDPALHVAVQQAARALGFNSYTYGCLMERVDGVPLLLVSSPFSAEELFAYHCAGLMQRDERIRHCGEIIVPGSWTIDELSLAKTNPVFARAFAERGMASGVFFPIHGIGGEVGMLACFDRALILARAILPASSVRSSQDRGAPSQAYLRQGECCRRALQPRPGPLRIATR